MTRVLLLAAWAGVAAAYVAPASFHGAHRARCGRALRRFADRLTISPPPCHVCRAAATGVRSAAAPATSPISMKVFDWKRRTDTYSEESEFKLHNLRPAPGSAHRKIRKGRGMGSGKGGSAGYGMRGQLSRGGRPTRPGFEGGQTPLYRRIPKLRGQPMGPGHTKTVYGLIKVRATGSRFAAAACVLPPGPGGGAAA